MRDRPSRLAQFPHTPVVFPLLAGPPAARRTLVVPLARLQQTRSTVINNVSPKSLDYTRSQAYLGCDIPFSRRSLLSFRFGSSMPFRNTSVNQPVSANELLTNSSVHGKNFHDMRARSYRVERISTASTWLWLMLETMPFDRGGRCERHQNISNQTMPRRPVASPSRGADAADGAEMLPGFDAWTPPRSDTSPNRRATTPAQSPMSEFLQEEANDNDSDIRGMAQSFWTRR
jgi:hypothetical protein